MQRPERSCVKDCNPHPHGWQMCRASVRNPQVGLASSRSLLWDLPQGSLAMLPSPIAGVMQGLLQTLPALLRTPLAAATGRSRCRARRAVVTCRVQVAGATAWAGSLVQHRLALWALQGALADSQVAGCRLACRCSSSNMDLELAASSLDSMLISNPSGWGSPVKIPMLMLIFWPI